MRAGHDTGPLMDDALLRLVMRDSAIAMAVVEPTGAFLAVNRAMCTFLGRDEATLLRSTWQDLTHPEDLHVGVDLVADLIVGRIDSFRVRKRYVRPDGEIVCGDASVAGVRHEDGRLRLNISQIVDVTREVHTAEALAASEARFRVLAENAADVVYRSGADHLITWVAPTITSALGWAPEEIVGTPFAALLHPDDLSRVAAQGERLYRGEQPSYPDETVEVRVLCKDGSYRWMTGRAHGIYGADGAISGVISGMHVVDDLVRAREHADEQRVLYEVVLRSMLEPHVVLRAVRQEGAIVDFEYLDGNDIACSYMHIPRESLVGLRVRAMAPDPVGAEIVAMYAGVVESGEPLVLDDWAYPHQQPGSELRYDIRGVAIGDVLSFTWRDVTARHAEQRRLAESEEEYRLLALNAADVVLHTRAGEVLWVSPSIGTALGWEPADWAGRQLREVVDRDDVAAIERARQRLNAGEEVQLRLRIPDRAGVRHWIDLRGRPYLRADGQQDGAALSFRLADAEVATQAELERRARYDDLTGALTRREAVDGVNARSRHVGRTGTGTGVLFVDIDRFKQVNDSLGHEAGDEVLRSAAARIAACVRSGDLVARIGGDEFLVVLDGVHGLGDATALAEKVRRAVHEPLDVAGGTVESTVSIGVTLMHPGEGFDSLVARADDAMYAAKQAGRDRVVAIEG